MTARYLLVLLSCFCHMTVSGAEPTVGPAGWTNVPGVVEGTFSQALSIHAKSTAAQTDPPLSYVDYLPKGYSPTSGIHWPVVFYFAGSGEFYDNIPGDGFADPAYGTQAYRDQLFAKMTVHGPLYQVKAARWDFPCIVIAVQQTQTARWNNAATQKAFVDYILARYRCDTDRIYITGLCEGASGLLRYAAAYPSTLAGIMPIIAIDAPTDAQAQALSKMPMWIALAFGDQQFPRRNSIDWLDRTTRADFGGTSNVMATYPAYAGVDGHYACDVGSDGKPAAWGGALWSYFSNTSVTPGSALLGINQTMFSVQAQQMTGTDARPFTRVKIANGSTIYTTYGASHTARTVTLTQPYAGPASGKQRIDIQLPTGYTATAHRDAEDGSWIWRRDLPVGPGRRLLSMYWYESHTGSWKTHWSLGETWDWLFTQHVNHPPVITPPGDLTLIAGRGATVDVVTGDADQATVELTADTDQPAVLTDLVVGGTDHARTLAIGSAPSTADGSATVTLTARDDYGAETTASFQVQVLANAAPVIDPPADLSLPNSSPASDALAIALSDDHDGSGAVTLAATSDDPLLLPPEDIILGGSGGARTISVRPAQWRSGSATVTLQATDSDGLVGSATFTVTVGAAPVPWFEPLAEQELIADRTLEVPVTVHATGTISALGATSDAQGVIADAGLVLTGSGAERTLTITPIAGATGTATITLSATDPGGTGELSFQVRVVADALPVIVWPSTATVTRGVVSAPFSIRVSDDHDAPEDIALVATTTAADTTLNLTGDGADRELTILAGASAPASLTVKLKATDAHGRSRTRNIAVTVVEDAPPTIEPFAAVTVIQGRSSGILAFTVGDDLDADPTVAATGGDAVLLPPSALVLGGSGSERTLEITPPANRSGSTVVTLGATDDAAHTTTVDVPVTILADLPPTLAPLADLDLRQDQAAVTVALDAADDHDELALTVSCDDPSLFAGGAPELDQLASTLLVTPAPGASGTSIVTVTVEDLGGHQAVRTFVVTVEADLAPVLTGDFSDRTMLTDGLPIIIPFTVADDHESVDDLAFTVSSDAPELLGPATLALGGSGAERQLVIAPAAGLSGVGEITISATDPLGHVGTAVIVLAVLADAPPTLATVGSATLIQGRAAELALTIEDDHGSAGVPGGYASPTTLLGSLVFSRDGETGPWTVAVTPSGSFAGSGTLFFEAVDANSHRGYVAVPVEVLTDAPATISADQDAVELISDRSTATVLLTVGDDHDAAADVQVAAVADDGALLPPEALVLSGSGATRTLTIANAPGLAGGTEITVTATDLAGRSSLAVIAVTVLADLPPTLAVDPASASFVVDRGPVEVVVTVGDDHDAAGDVALTVASTDGQLLPTAALGLSGSGASRTLTIGNGTGRSGTAEVLLTATDLSGRTTTVAIPVTVLADLPPTLVAVPSSVAFHVDAGPVDVALTVGDDRDPASAVTLTAVAADTALLPSGSLVLAGSGASRTLSIAHAPGLSGSTSVAVTATDPAGHRTVVVIPVLVAANLPPTLTANRLAVSFVSDRGPKKVTLTVGDDQDAPEAIVVTAIAADATLVPASALKLTGTGASRTLAIKNAPGRSGTTTVTVSAADPGGQASTVVIAVEVLADLAPTLVATPAAIGIHVDADPVAVALAVGDDHDAAGDVSLSAVAADAVLIPLETLVLTGSGASRALSIAGAPGRTGTTTVTVTATDLAGHTTSVVIPVQIADDLPPTLVAGTQAVSFVMDRGPVPVELTVGDDVDAADAVVVTAIAADGTLLPPSSLTLTGDGASRTLSIANAPGRSGATTVALTAVDLAGHATTTVIAVSVQADLPPTLVANPTSVAFHTDAGPGTVALTVGDDRDGAGALVLTAVAGNTVLLPPGSLTLSGSGASRVLSIASASGRRGSTTVAVTATDLAGHASTVVLPVLVTDDLPPTVVPDRSEVSFIVDRGPAAVALALADDQDPASALVVTVVASDSTLLPPSSLTLSGTGARRTLALRNAAGRSGTATVAITTIDLAGHAATTTIAVTVVADLPPTLAVNPPSVSLRTDSAPTTVGLAVGDDHDAAAALLVTAVAADAALLPPGSLTLSGGGATRSLSISPAPGRDGTTTVTVTAKDLAGHKTVVVVPVRVADDLPPTLIASLAEVSFVVDRGPATVGLTVGDDLGTAGSVILVAAAADAELLPASSLVLTGSGASRSLSIGNAPGRSGTTTVTVAAIDSNGHVTTRTLPVTVESDGAPTLAVAPSEVGFHTDAGPASVAVTVGDDHDPAAAVSVTAVSADTTLLPPGLLTLSGSGASRVLSIASAPGLRGTTTVTVAATDLAGHRTEVEVAVRVADDLPPTLVLSDAAVSFVADRGPSIVDLTVGDDEDADASIVMTAVAADAELVPSTSLLLSGSGANRSLSIANATGRSGTTTVTVTAADLAGHATVRIITVTVVADRAPTLAVNPTTVGFHPDAGPVTVSLTVGDDHDPAAAVSVTAVSADTTLIPSGSLVLSGSGAFRALSIASAPGLSGTTTVRVRATDLAGHRKTVTLTVLIAGDLPPSLVASVTAASFVVDRGPASVGLTVGDDQDAASAIVVSAAAADAELIPPSSLVLTGTGAKRTLKITNASGRSGATTVTVTATDLTGHAATQVIAVTVLADLPPVIAADPAAPRDGDGTLRVARPYGAGPLILPFTVSDDHDPAAALGVGIGAHPADVGLTIGGSGASRTLTIAPDPTFSGTVLATITASDLSGHDATQTVRIVVAGPPGAGGGDGDGGGGGGGGCGAGAGVALVGLAFIGLMRRRRDEG